ncbi:MAG: molybdenum ABC transporter ATP-binding protein [Betaproteobacteria bacterium]
MMERLRVRARKALASFVLDAELDLPLSGLTVLFGASGAGKSTLMNLIAGLHRPDAGHVQVGPLVFFDADRSIDVPVERRGLGVVFQDARLFPHLSVQQNLAYGLKRARGRPVAIGLDAVVELLGIRALLMRRPHTLSGGERQRVAIGRALLAQPRLLLMDEPLASLDAPRKAELLPYIDRLRDVLRVPIVYVTHSIDEVLRLATSLVLLDGGRVVAAGSLSEVLRAPAARRLLGESQVGTLVFGRVQAHDDNYGLTTIACDGFELRVPRLPLPPGAAVRARLPAREIALALARPVDVSITNRLPGVVQTVESHDVPYCAVQVRIGRSTVLTVNITRESADRLALAPSLPVWCLIKTVALDAGALALASGSAAEAPAPASSATNDARFPPATPPR